MVSRSAKSRPRDAGYSGYKISESRMSPGDSWLPSSPINIEESMLKRRRPEVKHGEPEAGLTPLPALYAVFSNYLIQALHLGRPMRLFCPAMPICAASAITLVFFSIRARRGGVIGMARAMLAGVSATFRLVDFLKKLNDMVKILHSNTEPANSEISDVNYKNK